MFCKWLHSLLLVLSVVAGEAKAAMPAVDRQRFDVCVAMSADAIHKDKACVGLIQRLKISQTEVTQIRACRELRTDALLKDKGCVEMVDKYPEMMRAYKAPLSNQN